MTTIRKLNEFKSLLVVATLLNLAPPQALSMSDFNHPAGPVPETYEDDPNVEGPFYDRRSRARRSTHARTFISIGPIIGSGSVGLLASVTRISSRFLGWEVSGFHLSSRLEQQQRKIRLIHYGGDVSLRAHLLNFGPITPYLGAGPGWEVWQRDIDGNDFDSASSPLGVYYVGAVFAISPHFSLGMRHKTVNYLGSVPKSWKDTSREDRSQSSLQIQFLVGF